MTPSSNPGQVREALRRANATRLQRAALRREVAGTGDKWRSLERVAELVLEPPAVVETATVHDVICWSHRVGREAARRYLLAAGAISETRTVGALTQRQREALAAALRSGRGRGRAGR